MVLGQAQKVALGKRGAGGGQQTETACTRVMQQEGRTESAVCLQRLGKPAPEWQAQPGCSKPETAC